MREKVEDVGFRKHGTQTTTVAELQVNKKEKQWEVARRKKKNHS